MPVTDDNPAAAPPPDELAGRRLLDVVLRRYGSIDFFVHTLRADPNLETTVLPAFRDGPRVALAPDPRAR